MSQKTKTAGAGTPTALKNQLPTQPIITDTPAKGQPLPRLRSLTTPEDFKDEEVWQIIDLAEDAAEIYSERIRNDFSEEVKEIINIGNEADLEVLTRAFRHCREVNKIDAAQPGRVLASILLHLGIKDLGTGRHEKTREILALRNASERLTKAGVQFIDDTKEVA